MRGFPGEVESPVRRLSTAFAALVLLVVPGCWVLSRPRTEASPTGREFSTTVLLHGKPLELHLAQPRTPATSHVVVIYASGDGGWFGTAVDMFHQIGQAGYFAVGFSSRSFLKIERPRGALVSAAQLTAEYAEIISMG